MARRKRTHARRRNPEEGTFLFGSALLAVGAAAAGYYFGKQAGTTAANTANGTISATLPAANS